MKIRANSRYLLVVLTQRSPNPLAAPSCAYSLGVQTETPNFLASDGEPENRNRGVAHCSTSSLG